MPKKITSIIVVVAFLMVTITTKCISSEWIDDWIQQKTVVSPQYFETQKRGYATLGQHVGKMENGSRSSHNSNTTSF